MAAGRGGGRRGRDGAEPGGRLHRAGVRRRARAVRIRCAGPAAGLGRGAAGAGSRGGAAGGGRCGLRRDRRHGCGCRVRAEGWSGGAALERAAPRYSSVPLVHVPAPPDGPPLRTGPSVDRVTRHSTGWTAPRGNGTGACGTICTERPLPSGTAVWQAAGHDCPRRRPEPATTGPPPISTPRWPSWTWRPSTPTPTTWCAARPASRSGWRASRCAAEPCWSGCWRVPGSRGSCRSRSPESLWLARAGFDDVLLAYPSADRSAYAELAADPKLAAAVTVMVDDHAQLELIDAARAGGTEEIRVCLELDTSLRLLGGRVRIGAAALPAALPRPTGRAGPVGGAQARLPAGGPDGVRGSCRRGGRLGRRAGRCVPARSG